MDYHFILPNDKGDETSNKGSFFSSLKRLLPVFILAALLPGFIYFVSTPPDVRFSTRANTDGVLRIWLEPSQSVASVDKSLSFEVVGRFEGGDGIIPSLSVEARSDGLLLFTPTVSHKRPFAGEVVLGTIEAQTEKSGVYQVTLPEELVEVVAYDKPLSIVTTGATVHVR